MQASQIGKSYEKTDRTQRRRAGLWTCLFLFTGQKSGEDVNVPLTKVEIVSTGEWDEDGNEVEDGKTRITVDDEEGDGVFTAHANHYDEEVSYGWVKLKYTWTNPWTNAEQTYGASSEEDSTLYIVSDIYSIELDYRNNSDMMLPNDAMTVDASLFHEFIGENGQDSEYMENFTLEINPDTIDETNNEYFSAELTDDKKGIRITTKGKENYDIRFQIIAKDGEENELTDEWITANISDASGYYLIQPASLTTGEGENVQNVIPNLGEELDISSFDPTLCLYDSSHDGDKITPGDNIRIRLDDYDTNCWDVKEATKDNLIPTLIRKCDG